MKQLEAIGRLDQLAPGQQVGVSEPFVIDQMEENVFAALIGDYDPMHNDPSWKLNRNWEHTIVLGFHALSLAERFLRECGLARESELETVELGRVRFVGPLPVGQEAACSVHLDGVEQHDGRSLVRTTLTVNRLDTGASTMIAEHVARVGQAESREAQGCPDVGSIPSGHPIDSAVPHDNDFYRSVAQRTGEWLGATPWTSVDVRSANAFRVLVDPWRPVVNHPDAADADHVPPIHPLHLLALRSYFMPQVGLPVLSDDRMAAFNYGIDGATWYRPVPVNSRLRDHVQLLDVREKSSGRWLAKSRHVLEAEGIGEVLTADCLSLFVVDGAE